MGKQVSVKSLSERAQSIKDNNSGVVSVDEVNNLVESIIAGANTHAQSQNIPADLQETITLLENSRQALDELKAYDFVHHRIVIAKDHLDEIVTQTEQVAGTIMDAAEEIGEISSMVDEKAAARLETLATKLFESSTFQDITGQRISKVERLFGHLNERLSNLATAIGDTYVAPEEEIEKDEEGIALHDEDLLNGPQLEVEANSQEDIDAILAMFD